MIKNTITMILEILLYSFILNYFDLLTKESLILGIVVFLILMGITILDEICQELKKLYGAMAVLFVGLDIEEKIKTHNKEK